MTKSAAAARPLGRFHMRAAIDKIQSVGLAPLLACLILVFGQIWGILLYSNLRTSPQIPWAAAAMIPILWLMWQYLGGRWPPRTTSELRRRCLRANAVPGGVFAWSMLAGILSIVALSGCWIVFFQIFEMRAN